MPNPKSSVPEHHSITPTTHSDLVVKEQFRPSRANSSITGGFNSSPSLQFTDLGNKACQAQIGKYFLNISLPWIFRVYSAGRGESAASSLQPSGCLGSNHVVQSQVCISLNAEWTAIRRSALRNKLLPGSIRCQGDAPEGWGRGMRSNLWLE